MRLRLTVALALVAALAGGLTAPTPARAAPSPVVSAVPVAPKITAPGDGSTTPDPLVPIVGTGTPGAMVDLTINDAVVASAAIVYENGGWLYTPDEPMAPGRYTVTATQTVYPDRSDPSEPVTVTITAPPTITLTSSRSEVGYGIPVALTATVGAVEATGSVTFFDRPSSGPGADWEVELGTVPVAAGSATIEATLPAFGVHTLAARYNGDATHAEARSADTDVSVAGWWGQLIISELRSSGPAGPGDSYLELYNTGPDVPLGGLRIESSSGATIDLPTDAPTLARGRTYLVAGPDFSLPGSATPDLTAELGTGGWRLLAPDARRTLTDAVGPTSGFHQGGGLPTVSGEPTAQYGFVRVQRAGRPVNTAENVDDFALVATDGGSVGGVRSMLGAPSPTGRADDQPSTELRSARLDPRVSASAAANRSYLPGAPGRLIVRRTITNTSDRTITSARARITALSQQNGRPNPNGTQPDAVAQLRVVAPWGGPTSLVPTSTRGSIPVQNLTPDPPSSGQPGGGLNSSLTIPLPDGGLAPGQSVDVAFSFEVDAGGAFWFAYDTEARTAGG